MLRAVVGSVLPVRCHWCGKTGQEITCDFEIDADLCRGITEGQSVPNVVMQAVDIGVVGVAARQL
ncbi:hypothetical protein A5743_22795 [Mycolicibacterium conceptionense]|nr:hypothetical protein A5743_22795 [Mycolicibacterium conceptionense]